VGLLLWSLAAPLMNCDAVWIECPSTSHATGNQRLEVLHPDGVHRRLVIHVPRCCNRETIMTACAGRY